MGEVSNEVLYNLLCEIKGDVGEIKAGGEATRQWLAKHVEDDKQLADDVKALEITAAKALGSARTWGLVGAGAASILGGLAGLFGPHHG